MIESSVSEPEVRWDQTEFEKLRATWSPSRIARDKKDLEKIFTLTEDSPLLAEALEWAHQHGMKFFIDRQAVNLGGYYSLGTGVLALVPASLGTGRRAAEVMVHEIRHAWQDYHGLISWDDKKPNDGSFSDFFINNALIEADAMAYGNLAAMQVDLAKDKKTLSGLKYRSDFLSKQEAKLADENARLEERFLAWFKDSYRTKFYGDYFSKMYGKKWGLYNGAMPARNTEFKTKARRVEGMNINNVQDVLQLGLSFSGTKNYLAEMQPDILPRQILRPSLANTFWGAAQPAQKKLTTELRKAYLKKKLAPENRKKHHPWP